MKPKDWQKCPYVILDTFLWNLDLDYDSYESSLADTIHSIHCNGSDGTSRQNIEMIEERWNALTEEEFSYMCKNCINSLESQIDQLRDFIKE